MRKYFRVEISDNPDFLICSNRPDNGVPFSYTKHDCVKICFMGENISPDFTSFDYVIGFDFLDFGDRYFRLPFGFYSDDAKPWIPKTLSETEAKKILQEKKYFCNFIYGHPSSHGIRELLKNKLDEYQHVISPGRYLNNTGTSGCSWSEKHVIVRESKFTIACDSIHYPGFVTEKIVDAFKGHSIPIYFGSTKIEEDFNLNAFINCRDERDIDDIVEQIIEIDRNDEQYLNILTQCPLPSVDHLTNRYDALERFLVSIFSQNPEQARRRVRYYCADTYQTAMKRYNSVANKIPNSIKKYIKP